MNFKKTWKRFFTVSRASEGFTLVELIVVIAILAILAGIAVPAYSGYIKKANKAADLQLLGAVNTAFAAACLENGKDANSLTSVPSITLRGEVGEKEVAGITVEGAAEPYTTSFMKYFDGNNSAKFKVIKALRFLNGAFVEDEGNTLSYGGGSIFVTDAQLAALRDSTFNSEALGLEGLLDQVDTMAGLAMSFGNDAFANVIGTEAYMTHMVRALGGNVNAEDITAEFARVASGLADTRVAEQMNITVEELQAREDYDDLVASTQQEIGQNMAVLYAAQNASNRTAADVMNVINSDTLKSDLLKSMTGTNPGQGLGDAALVYGAFTAYAYATNSQAGIAAIQNSNDPTAVFDLLGSGSTELANFQNYMNTNPQAARDLDATLAAMGVVNNSASDQSALTEVLLNGYNDGALKDLIGDLMGE